jgi:hypothetical protein
MLIIVNKLLKAKKIPLNVTQSDRKMLIVI